MSNDSDLVLVVGLALLIEDREEREQAALLRVARKLDYARNKQTVNNPHLRGRPLVECDYTEDHPKSGLGRCACAPPVGQGRLLVRKPKDGWSRLVAWVESTWDPHERWDEPETVPDPTLFEAVL